MKDGMLTLGYIGNGKSANRYHLPFAHRPQDGIRVKTVYARHLPSDVWAAVDGVRYTTDPEELLGDAEIDAVVITTPAAAHREWGERVLRAGKNCVIEKPFTPTLADAQALFQLAAERGLLLEGYQNRRFDSDLLTAQTVLASGRLGTLREAEFCWDYYRPQVPESMTRYEKEYSALYGISCHLLDQAVALFGAPERVHYDVRQLRGADRMNDYADIDLYYGALKVSCKCAYSRLEARPVLTLYGDRGVFTKRDADRQEVDLKRFYMPDNPDFGRDRPEDFGTLVWAEEDGTVHREAVPTVNGDWARYFDALRDTLLHGAPPLVTPEQTLLQMKLLEDGERAMLRAAKHEGCTA